MRSFHEYYCLLPDLVCWSVLYIFNFGADDCIKSVVVLGLKDEWNKYSRPFCVNIENEIVLA